MGGLKNSYQLSGGTPISQIEGNTIEERDWAFRTRQLTPFCQLCGNEIINSSTNEFGQKVDADWERENQLHYRCLLKRQNGSR